MNCKVVLRFLLYIHSRPPASIFPLYPHYLNLISPSQMHPAVSVCCQTPLSLPALSYSNDIPPRFPKENATAHAGAEEFSSSKSNIYASFPFKGRCPARYKTSLSGIRRFGTTQYRRFPNAPNPLYFLPLYAKTLIFLF